jgi:hypothetical protein
LPAALRHVEELVDLVGYPDGAAVATLMELAAAHATVEPRPAGQGSAGSQAPRGGGLAVESPTDNALLAGTLAELRKKAVHAARKRLETARSRLRRLRRPPGGRPGRGPGGHGGTCRAGGRTMCEVCGSPFGKIKRVIGELLDLAENGTMTIERSDAVHDEVVTAIANVDGTLCECGDCMGTVELQSVCAQWLDRIADIIFEGEDLGDYGGHA